MKVHLCEQGSEQWWRLRRGVPTASNFDKILTPGGKLSEQADGYINMLIAETFLAGPPTDLGGYMSRPMIDGVETEPEARAWYALHCDADPVQVGFCTTDDERFGCSPDALVGDDGGLELKCPLLATHIGYLRANALPPKYRLQVHGSLWVTGRKWWDFVSYAPGLPPLVVRVLPDEFTARVGEALDQFWPVYREAVRMIEAMRADAPAPAEGGPDIDDPIFAVTSTNERTDEPTLEDFLAPRRR